jgi:hypothetical protein
MLTDEQNIESRADYDFLEAEAMISLYNEKLFKWGVSARRTKVQTDEARAHMVRSGKFTSGDDERHIFEYCYSADARSLALSSSIASLSHNLAA